MQRWIEVVPGIRITGDGAAWLVDHRTLVVADVHIGYAHAARRRGGYLPHAERGADVGARLARMADQHDCATIVVAGDLRHSTRDLDDLERDELAHFADVVRERHELRVVLGNHDRGDAVVDDDARATLSVGSVCILHEPPRITPDAWSICGHLHPRVTLRDPAGAGARYPAALVGERLIVLPAFSEWAGGTSATRLLGQLPEGRWRALPISDGFIADVGLTIGDADESPAAGDAR